MSVATERRWAGVLLFLMLSLPTSALAGPFSAVDKRAFDGVLKADVAAEVDRHLDKERDKLSFQYELSQNPDYEWQENARLSEKWVKEDYAELTSNSVFVVRGPRESCPLDYVAYNVTNEDLYNIVIKVTMWLAPVKGDGEVQETKKKEKLVHIPVLPAWHSVDVDFDCMPGTAAKGTILPGALFTWNTYDRVVKGRSLNTSTIKSMCNADADFDLLSDRFVHNDEIRLPDNLLSHAFRLLADDEIRMGRLAGRAIHSKVGAEGLVKHVAATSRFDQPAWLQSTIERASPSSGWRLLDATLKLSVPDGILDTLGRPAIQRQCSRTDQRDRKRSADLWFRALDGELNGESTAKEVLASCVPDEALAVQGLVERADRVGTVVDALELLDTERAKASIEALHDTAGGRAALRRLAARTTDPERLELAVQVLLNYPEDLRLVALSLGEAKEGPLAERKAELLETALVTAQTSMTPEEYHALLTDLLDKVLKNLVEVTPIRQSIVSRTPGTEQSFADQARRSLDDTSVILDPDEVQRWAGAGGVDIVAFAVFNRYQLQGCKMGITPAEVCARRLAENYPDLAADTVDEAYLTWLGSKVRGYALEAKAREVAAMYSTWGLDVSGLAKGVCEDASSEYRGGSRERGDSLLAAAREIDPETGCATWVTAGDLLRRFLWGVATFAGFSVSGIPVIAAFVITRRKTEILFRAAERAGGQGAVDDDERVDGEGETLMAPLAPGIQRALQEALAQAHAGVPWAGAAPPAGLERALAATEEGDCVSRFVPVVRRALHDGEIGSLLLKLDDAAVYLVAFPDRHEFPQLLRRHAGFALGWLAHVKQVQRKLAAGEDGPQLLALGVFLAPDGHDGVLLPTFVGEGEAMVAECLLDPEERAAESAVAHGWRQKLELV